MEIVLGTYRHFKGGRYEVIGVAKHSETQEEFIIYRPLDSDNKSLWARPKSMFLETIIVDEKEIQRFTLEEK